MQPKRIFRSIVLVLIVWVIVLTDGTHWEINKKNVVYAEETSNSQINVELLMKREYLDGEISEEIIKETYDSLDQFWSKNEQWRFIGIKDNKLVFSQEIDDISPLLKANGYFGLSGDGILTIFNGKPNRSNIIHSFFQIDVGKLESTKRKELRQGIPVKTKNHYVEILETYKTYSKNIKLK